MRTYPPRTIEVPFRMTTECQYSRDPMALGQKDLRCEGVQVESKDRN